MSIIMIEDNNNKNDQNGGLRRTLSSCCCESGAVALSSKGNNGSSSCDSTAASSSSSSCTTTTTTTAQNSSLSIEPLPPTAQEDNSSDKNNNNNDSSRYSSFKFFLLALMVVQTSSNVLVGRYSRSAPVDELYEVNHAVMGIEVTKFCLACLLEHYTCITGNSSGSSLCKSIQIHVIHRPKEALQMLIPSMLYLVQNTLMYVALTNLSAPLFQVTYQGKLVTTAIVSVIMLRRSYSIQQWICLVGISLGVAIVVNGEQAAQKMAAAAAAYAEGSVAVSSSISERSDRNLIWGLTAVCIACFSSALAGVYFEKILKHNNNSNASKNNKKQSSSPPPRPTAENKSFADEDQKQPPQSLQQSASLWMRNIQLAFFSIILAAAQGGLKNTGGKPYFYGFNGWTFALIAIQAVGGLLVAAVIKYADNVLKGLATGVSVVLSSLLSMLLFRTPIQEAFVTGGALILAAVWFFSNPLPQWCTSSPVAVFISSSAASIYTWFMGDGNKKETAEVVEDLLPR